MFELPLKTPELPLSVLHVYGPGGVGKASGSSRHMPSSRAAMRCCTTELQRSSRHSAGVRSPTHTCEALMLPLVEGENEILIGVANYFFGWGLIARLDDTEGILLE